MKRKNLYEKKNILQSGGTQHNIMQLTKKKIMIR